MNFRCDGMRAGNAGVLAELKPPAVNTLEKPASRFILFLL
jgi:hypothetical protein